MNRLLPWLLAVLKFASCLVLRSGQYELHRDEYLYLDHGRHLAWGYLEVPPALATQAWLADRLGGGLGWVKFWPALWGSLTLLLVCRLARQLGGGPWAVTLAGVCYLSTAFARVDLLFQPVSFEVLAFTAAAFFLVVYLQTNRPAPLYGLGAALGLGLLNKYSTLIFGAALLAALLLTRPGRQALGRRHLWLAAGLALLIWLPNLAWQLGHGLPFRRHMAELHATQLVHVTAGHFWKMQLLMCAAALWVWAPGVLLGLFGRSYKPYRAAALLFAAGLALLTVLHGKEYYSLGYYPPWFAFGAVAWERLLGQLSFAGLRRGVQAVLLLAPLAVLAPLLPLIYPLAAPTRMEALGRRSFYQNAGFYRWEDGQNHSLPQDYADMLGWRELAEKTYAAYQTLPDSVRGARTLVICANYGQAGAVNYYARQAGWPLPEAHSFNGSYQNWWPAPGTRWGAVVSVDDEPDPALGAHFRSWQRAGAVENPYARERGTAVLVGLGPDAALQRQVWQELAAARALWGGR